MMRTFVLIFLFFLLSNYKLQSPVLCSQEKFNATVRDIVDSVTGPEGTVCRANATEYRNFYLTKRADEAANHLYPPITDDDVIEQWRTDHSTKTFVCYYGVDFFSDINGNFGDISKEFFTWCIYVYSTEYDIYGCINSTQKWGSEAFKKLGLLDNMDFEASPSSPLDRGNLVFNQGENFFLRILDNSLVSCRVNWPWKSGTVGVYWRVKININSGIYPSIRKSNTSTQNDAFLVVGQQKMLHCTVNGDFVDKRYAWSYENHYVKLFNDYNCTIFDNGKDSLCSDVPQICFTIADLDSGLFSGCSSEKSELIQHGNRLLELYFSSPSLNDTGEYTCSASTFDTPSIVLESESLFIVVIFSQFPADKIHFVSPSNFTCEVKAPTNSTVYWKYALNDQHIKAFDMSVSQSLIGNADESTEPVVFVDERKLDDYYSLFNLVLKFSVVDVAFSGEYICAVDYTINGRNHTAQLSMDVTVTNKEFYDQSGLTVPKISGVAVGVVLLLVLLTLLIGVLSLIVLVKCMRKRRQRRGSKRPPKVVLTAHNKIYTQVSINSPGVDMEFPRESLKLLEELGKGRFGRVLRARAHGIVPNFPHLNTVAVKTTLSDSSIFQAEKLKEELEIMVDMSPHDNICNLLAYCTTPDGPLYLILEYACHGNLKSYLDLCARTIAQQMFTTQSNTNTDMPIDNDGALDGYDHLAVKEKSADSYDHLTVKETSIDSYDHLAIKEKSLDEYVSLYYNDDAFSPGFLKEEVVCNFAGQIACGLKHLHDMNVIHCDLAARNILIAEGLVLKISDFGMAKNCSKGCNSNSVIQSDAMVAAKWAPPEVLEDQIFSYKSDVWSFAIVIWEIASYGAHPYSDFKIGFSFNTFINHLKTGNKLAKPDGLSDDSYDKLCSCWSVDAELRPSAESLVDFFTLTDPNGSVNDFQVDLGLL